MAEPDVGNPLIGGDDLLMRIFIGPERFGDDLIVSGSVKPHSVKFRDDHFGNDVSNVDIRVFGWDLSIKTHYKTDRMIRACLAFYRAKAIPGNAALVMSIMLAIQERDATAKRPGYLFTPCVADFSLDLPGMKERLTQSLDVWAQTWEPYQVNS